MKKSLNYSAIDLFSGVGGLSVGLQQAGFQIKLAIENDENAIKAYRLNHPETKVLAKDIRKIRHFEIKKWLKEETLHLLAGCPPCQGFSVMRRLNRKRSIRDNRNSLVLEFFRLVNELKPLTIMMENVPGLINYYLFKNGVRELKRIGYNPNVEIVDVKDYGVPQKRKRLVLVGSILGNLEITKPNIPHLTVREAIAHLPKIDSSNDPIHKITAVHIPRIQEMINKIPLNGGSKKDLPEKYALECHKKKNIGFNDVYGRLKWDDYSSTITGGCLNPSKGRFLHPTENRCISAREAALLQTFPENYKFPIDIPKTALALLIGNALPPKFSYYQSLNIKYHIDKYFD
ncbi:MAG: DNA (cytosine-5-)-methyltransferase [Candidatus Lokiarchaeota archaeon]|nr:DNA (cytosine-5-)-methyltransferase [Candidatus Lokiarchaeota archaeon]